MSKYIFHITEKNSNFQLVDDWNEWISARDEFSAKHEIESAYPREKGYECTLIEVTN